MFTLILVLTLTLVSGVAGFFAGVKHAEKAKAIKSILKPNA
jgi:ABC-type antimicrobial peptide transport system permease subunit